MGVHIALAGHSSYRVMKAFLRSAFSPGFRLYPLKGHRAGQWSVRVSGNWPVVFRLKNGEAVGVVLIDYL